MKAFTLMPLKAALGRNLGSVNKAEPVFVSATSSMHMRPVEIRRYLRHLRENRQYNFTRDFVY